MSQTEHHSGVRRRERTFIEAAVRKPAVVALVVHEDEVVRRALVGVLRLSSIHALGASCGIDALHFLENNSVDIVICAQPMPHAVGADTLRAARQRCPNACFVLFTGFREPAALLETVQRSGADLALYWGMPAEEIRERLCWLRDCIQQARDWIR